MLRLSILFLLYLCCSSHLAAQSEVPGLWRSFDEESGEPNSDVRLSIRNGKLYGTINRIISGPSDALCTACSGSKRNKPIRGMEIIDGLSPSEGYWQNGKILDVRNGKTYRVRIRTQPSNPDRLEVRGYHWTGLSKTVIWQRIEKSK